MRTATQLDPFEAHVERDRLTQRGDTPAAELAAAAGYRGELATIATVVAAELLTDPDRPRSRAEVAEALTCRCDVGAAQITYDALARLHLRLADRSPDTAETIANRWERTWALTGGRVTLARPIQLGPEAGWWCTVTLVRTV